MSWDGVFGDAGDASSQVISHLRSHRTIRARDGAEAERTSRGCRQRVEGVKGNLWEKTAERHRQGVGCGLWARASGSFHGSQATRDPQHRATAKEAPVPVQEGLQYKYLQFSAEYVVTE